MIAWRLDGHRWNHKGVHRVYCALPLKLPRRTQRRVPRDERRPLDAPPELNATWAGDYMSDTLKDGRRFRTLNVIDEGNREGLAIDLGISFPSVRLLAVIEQLVAVYGPPQALRLDNWPNSGRAR